MIPKAEKQEEDKRRGLKKFNAIVDGWKHVLLPFTMTEAQRAIALKRAEICSTCPINVGNICSKTKGGCGCPITAKTKSFEGDNDCPKQLWKNL